MPAVEFEVRCETTPGEEVVVVGTGDAAGSWNPKHSQIKLSTHSEIYPRWECSTNLPKGLIEFKFAVLSPSDGEARWEQSIDNRCLDVTDIAAKLCATKFDCADQIVELALEKVEQPFEKVEQPLEDVELGSAAVAGTAPAGMMMGIAPAMEVTPFRIEEPAAEEAKHVAEVVEEAVPDNVVEAPKAAMESAQETVQSSGYCQSSDIAPTAQETAKARKTGKVAVAAGLKQGAKAVQ